jgi:hypothetical protein
MRSRLQLKANVPSSESMTSGTAPRKCTCSGGCSTCNRKSENSRKESGVGSSVDHPMKYVSGHEFSRVPVHSRTALGASNPGLSFNGTFNSVARSEISMNGPDDKPENKPRPAPPPPKETPGKPAATCPTDIRVAGVDPANDRDFGKNGFLTGWGAIAQMEVSDPSGKTWDGTKIKESLKQTKNTCGARARNVCSNKSGESVDFVVGSESNFLGKAKLPAVKNTFHDIHVFSLKDVSVLHERGKDSCEIECSQSFSCDGKKLGPDFSISYTLTKDVVAKTFDVSRVSVKKEAVVAKAAPPPNAPTGGTKP